MKKRLCVLAAALAAAALCFEAGFAREPLRGQMRVERPWSREEFPEAADPGLRGIYEEAAVDTYCLVWYDFETNNWQGWTRVDNTAQMGTFFHVDDFAGLEGGSFGRLAPIEGTKSMWCGARPNAGDPYFCGWQSAPGYGHNWKQHLATGPRSFVGAVTFSYTIVWDSEQDYDSTVVEYDAGGGNWIELASYTGIGNESASHFIPLASAATKLRFRFTSDGAWDDHDGIVNTDGACIVDGVLVSDSGGFLDFENFEGVPAGATAAGIWTAEPEPAYGRYSGLRNNLRDEDPCGENFGSQIVFWVGSPYPSAVYPGQYDTPFCLGPGGVSAPCQDEAVHSPYIDMTKYSTSRDETQDGAIPTGELPNLGGCILRFTVYRDLPMRNLVYYQWAVRKVVGGCPGRWRDFGSGYYGDDRRYTQYAADVSHFIAGDDPVQIRLGVVDMCDAWYLSYGDCAEHTTTPYFDNVRLYRYNTSGPRWGYRDLDLFQDNFPAQELDIESFVRADAANDINWGSNPAIRPGDSITVDCASPLGGGIAADPVFGGPAVYLHVKCAYAGPAPAKPDLAGPALAGSVAYGSPPTTLQFNYVSDDGVWTKIQCAEARTSSGSVVAGKYMVDLNDELFTRGYQIDYYFTAVDNAGAERALPRYARSAPPYFEWTCLPTLASDVLFVDDFSGRGSFAGAVENYWMPVFDAVLPPPGIDRYDVNAPSSCVSNGPGSRAKTAHLTSVYRAIVWDSGDLTSCTISDGTSNSDKSNDAQMLIDWMSASAHGCGVWICGDNVAYDLGNSPAPCASELMGSWCGVDVASWSYFSETGGYAGGGVVNPLVTGHAEAGVFVHGGAPDRFYVYGGCPLINQFDCLEKAGTGKYALSYPDFGGSPYYAAVANETTNAGDYPVRTMWFGFSYQYLRDDEFASPIDRFEIAKDMFMWMNCATNPDVTGVEAPRICALSQNFPNPFNPSTTIRYDLAEKGLVTIRLYDVAGRLVRTLVDGVKDAGSYTAVWDGRNNLGASAASGIYFCKMESGSFGATRKVVMLR